FFQVAHGTTADERLRNLVHLNRGLYASVNILLLECVLQSESIDDRRQHAHVVCRNAVHIARLLGHAAEEVASAHDYGNLNAERYRPPTRSFVCAARILHRETTTRQGRRRSMR